MESINVMSKHLLISVFSVLSLVMTTPLYAAFAEDEGVPVINGYDEDYSSTHSTDSSEGNSTLRQRIKHIEQQVESLKQIGLLDRVNQMQQQLQEMQGKLEEQTHTLKTLQEQQRTFYND